MASVPHTGDIHMVDAHIYHSQIKMCLTGTLKTYIKLFGRNRTKGSSGQTRSISRICCLICLTDSPTNTPNNFDQWLMIKVLKVMLSEHVGDGYG